MSSKTIESAEISTDDSIDIEKILTSEKLPTIPAVAIRLLELTGNPLTEIREIVETVRMDPAICARILKSTNSSFFGFSSKITSINRAIPLLGKSVVTALTLSFSLHEGTVSGGSSVVPFDRYWKRSLVQAAAAEILRTGGNGELACEHFLAGLLLDLGQLALLNAIPETYVDLQNQAYDECLPLHEVENRKLGFDHVEVGVRLMKSWQLPESLILAAESHHIAVDRCDSLPKGEQNLTVISNIASIVGEYFVDSHQGKALEDLKYLTEKFFGFSEESLETYLQKVRVRITEVGELLNHNTDDIPEPLELMEQANEQLAGLIVAQQVDCTKAQVLSETNGLELVELENANAQLQEKALFDSLTKLYNRTFFDESLKNEVAHAIRSAAPLGLVYFDIDHFKNINDSYGHTFGDEVLARIGSVILETVRKSDIVARHGGEEFVVLMSQPTRKGIERFSERIRQNIERAEFHFRSERIKVTVSVGAAIAIPNPKETNLEQTLICAADEAMYASKKRGRNCITIKSLIDEFEDDLTQTTRSKQYSRWLVSRGVLDVATVSRAILQSVPRPHRRLGEIGIEFGFLNEEQVEKIRNEQFVSNLRFGRTAIELGILSRQEVAQMLALQIENPHDLNDALVQMQSMSRDEATSLQELYFSQIINSPSINPGVR